MTPAGFPHSDIHGSTLESSSPWHFAGFHVLLRLLVPRHPPCALCSLTFGPGRPGWSRKPPSDGSSSRFLSSPSSPTCSRLTLASFLCWPNAETHCANVSRRSLRRKLCYSVDPSSLGSTFGSVRSPVLAHEFATFRWSCSSIQLQESSLRSGT